METIISIFIVILFYLISFAMVLLPLVSIILALLGKSSDIEKDKDYYFTWAKKSLLALLFIVLVGGGACFGLVALSFSEILFPHPLKKEPLQTEHAS